MIVVLGYFLENQMQILEENILKYMLTKKSIKKRERESMLGNINENKGVIKP